MAVNTVIFAKPYNQRKKHCHITNTDEDSLNNQYIDIDLVERGSSLENIELLGENVDDIIGSVQLTRFMRHNKRMVNRLFVGPVIGSFITGAVVFFLLHYNTAESLVETTSIPYKEEEYNKENLGKGYFGYKRTII